MVRKGGHGIGNRVEQKEAQGNPQRSRVTCAPPNIPRGGYNMGENGSGVRLEVRIGSGMWVMGMSVWRLNRSNGGRKWPGKG